MAVEYPTDAPLHERTMHGIDKVVDRAMGHVEGLEKMVVSRAVQLLHPRVAQRIRGASETELLTELKFLHNLLGDILQEPKANDGPKLRRKTKRKRSTQKTM